MKRLKVIHKNVQVSFQLYPTAALLRRAVRRALSGEHVSPTSVGYHIGAGTESTIYLAEQDKLWHSCGLHECVHSAEYLAQYRPEGVHGSEFLAYFADGLYSHLLRWALSDFQANTDSIDFSTARAKLDQAIDPSNSTETT